MVPTPSSLYLLQGHLKYSKNFPKPTFTGVSKQILSFKAGLVTYSICAIKYITAYTNITII